MALGLAHAAGLLSSQALSSGRVAFFVPIRVERGAGTPLRDAIVTLCAVDFAAHHANPTLTPMYRDLMTASGCISRHANDTIVETTLGALEDEFIARGCSPAGNFRDAAPGCVPTGMVFHASRCGSTLAANMLAVLPFALTYSEASPPLDVLWSSDLPPVDIVRALRVIMAAMGRPIAAAAATGQLPDVVPEALATAPIRAPSGPAAAAPWMPRHMYIKFQSSATPALHYLRRAFPESPWVFLYRDPVEILASLFRNAEAPPAPDALPTAAVGVRDRGVRDAPCLRHRGDGTPDVVRAMLGAGTRADIDRVSAEDYCAASVAHLCIVAFREAAAARRDAFVTKMWQTPRQPLANDGAQAEFESGYGLVQWLRSRGIRVGEAGGESDAVTNSGEALLWHPLGPSGEPADGRMMALLNGTTLRGTIARVGQGLLLPYETLPHALISAIRLHMGPRPVLVAHAEAGSTPELASQPRLIVDEVNDDAIAAMTAIARLYSKSRGRGGGGGAVEGGLRGGGGRGAFHNIGAGGVFIEDGDEKQAKAWPLLKAAAGRYLKPAQMLLRDVMVREGHIRTSTHGDDVPTSSLPSVARTRSDGVPSDPRGRSAAEGWRESAARARQLPLAGGYPMTYPLTQVLGRWNPDIVTLPSDYGRFQSLRVFDYATEREEAELYRRAEVPFVIRNLGRLLEPTIHTWSRDHELLAVMGETRHYTADVNTNNHFMYFHKPKALRDTSFKPPTTEKSVTMPDWLAHAHELAPAIFAEEQAAIPPGWAAPADVQAPGLGLNDPTVNGDAAARGAQGGGELRWSASGAPAWLPGGREGVADGEVDGAPPPSRPQRELWYLRATGNYATGSDWITTAFPMFNPSLNDNFFMVDATQQRGIHCRFGMPGVIAEAHYDQGRNFIAMVRGRKRYILSPPDQCEHLQLLREGPSARHSSVDWSSPEGIARLANATGAEVILEAGDVLYIPAYWFHFIVSLTINIQCNSRSGTPPQGAQPIADCGFEARFSEPAGVHTSLNPPLHHLMAIGEGLASDLALRDRVSAARRLAALARADSFATLDIGEPRFGAGDEGRSIAVISEALAQLQVPGKRQQVHPPWSRTAPAAAARGDGSEAHGDSSGTAGSAAHISRLEFGYTPVAIITLAVVIAVVGRMALCRGSGGRGGKAPAGSPNAAAAAVNRRDPAPRAQAAEPTASAATTTGFARFR